MNQRQKMRVEKTKETVDAMGVRSVYTVVIEVEEDPHRPKMEQVTELLRLAHEFTGGERVEAEMLYDSAGKTVGQVLNGPIQ